MEDSFKTLDKKEAIDVAYLCVKETSSRVEGREKELLSLTKEWNIPTIVIFTNTQEKFCQSLRESQFRCIFI
ncbi:hypothetical protein HpCHN86_06210 [Helicobacter pylori]